MYDPVTAKFLSDDPIRYAGGDVNLNRYCANNPVTNIDPGGTQVEDPNYAGPLTLAGKQPTPAQIALVEKRRQLAEERATNDWVNSYDRTRMRLESRHLTIQMLAYDLLKGMHTAEEKADIEKSINMLGTAERAEKARFKQVDANQHTGKPRKLSSVEEGAYTAARKYWPDLSGPTPRNQISPVLEAVVLNDLRGKADRGESLDDLSFKRQVDVRRVAFGRGNDKYIHTLGEIQAAQDQAALMQENQERGVISSFTIEALRPFSAIDATIYRAVGQNTKADDILGPRGSTEGVTGAASVAGSIVGNAATFVQPELAALIAANQSYVNARQEVDQGRAMGRSMGTDEGDLYARNQALIDGVTTFLMAGIPGGDAGFLKKVLTRTVAGGGLAGFSTLAANANAASTIDPGRQLDEGLGKNIVVGAGITVVGGAIHDAVQRLGPTRSEVSGRPKATDDPAIQKLLNEKRAPGRFLEENEGMIIDGTKGLQSRISGRFLDPVVGTHGDSNTMYLWTIDERGINIALEKTPFPTKRGNIVHSNISVFASFGGEAWFGPDNTVTINANSGRWGITTSGSGGGTAEMYAAAVRFWQSLGYKVTAIPIGEI